MKRNFVLNLGWRPNKIGLHFIWIAYFLQKQFVFDAKKHLFCTNISLSLPENSDFPQIFETLGEQMPPSRFVRLCSAELTCALIYKNGRGKFTTTNSEALNLRQLSRPAFRNAEISLWLKVFFLIVFLVFLYYDML